MKADTLMTLTTLGATNKGIAWKTWQKYAKKILVLNPFG
jgi:hypothetical protein